MVLVVAVAEQGVADGGDMIRSGAKKGQPQMRHSENGSNGD